MKTIVIILILLCLWTIYASEIPERANIEVTDHETNETFKPHGTAKGIRVVGWKMHHLKEYFALTVFIIAVTLVKLLYHHLEVIASYIPESCVLIALGVLYGLVIRFAFPEATNKWSLNPDLFFLILLPPIILEASFGLYNRTFGENILTVLIFAIFGTLLNFLIIGLSLWGLSAAGGLGPPTLNLSILHALLFSSLIVAVDPVAVLAIFQEIGVDDNLYYLVFGESLLNDAVTIVLYNMMQAFLSLSEITTADVALGVVSFFTVSLGGFVIGVVIGVLSCLVTRITYVTPIIEPLIILSFGYFSYIAGDLFEWSGIISIIGCGLVQSAYAFHNLTRKSLTSLKRFTRMVAGMSEAMIFLFLGVELVTGHLECHTGFSLWTLVLCLVARGLVVFLLSAMTNRLHSSIRNIGWTEKFVFAYGGLRGAVAFSLAALVKEDGLGSVGLTKAIISTTTLFIILFTVVVMGLTVKPIVKLLKIKLQNKHKLSLINEMNESVLDHLMAGMEAILGHKGQNTVHEWFERMDDKFIRRFLQRDPRTHDQKILVIFEKLTLAMHYATIQGKDSEHHLDKMPSLLRQKVREGSIQGGETGYGIKLSPSAVELVAAEEEENEDQHKQPMLPRGFSRKQHPERPLDSGSLRKLLYRSSMRRKPGMDDEVDEKMDFASSIGAVVRAKNAFLTRRRRGDSSGGADGARGAAAGQATGGPKLADIVLAAKLAFLEESSDGGYTTTPAKEEHDKKQGVHFGVDEVDDEHEV